jgi:hypothetical protein
MKVEIVGRLAVKSIDGCETDGLDESDCEMNE